MPRSTFRQTRPAGQPPPNRAEDGLSLVEVMVTLSIIAITTSLIMLTTPSRPLHLRESERLRDILEQSAQRALITGQPTGMVVDGNTYSMAVWQDSEWTMLARRQLSPDMEILIDGKPIQHTDPDVPIAPAVVFDPLGHTAPVAIVLARNSLHTSLILLPDGKVQIEAVQ